jgi:hypothetical protein
VATLGYLGMIFLSFNATQNITLPIRDWKYGNDTLTSYGTTWRMQAKFLNKDTRVVINFTITSPSFDKDTRELTFAYNSTTLDPEVPYILRIEDQQITGGIPNLSTGKVLTIDKIYMLPSGSTIDNYQPVLQTTERTMSNDFVIYGE